MANTAVLLPSHLRQPPERAFTATASGGMTVYGLAVVLSFAIAGMPGVYVHIGQR